MKPLLYALLFAGILGVMGFSYFATATPDIPQQVVTKTLSSKDAFPSKAF